MTKSANKVKARTASAPLQSSRGRPKLSDSADDAATRRKILAAALKTFSQRGFEGASIADIARIDGVSPPLIHYYFKNKMDLWRAAVEYGGGAMIHDLEEIMSDLADADSLSRLKFFIRRYVALMAKRLEVFQ